MNDMRDMLLDYLIQLYALCENDSQVQKTVLYQQNRNRDFIWLLNDINGSRSNPGNPKFGLGLRVLLSSIPKLRHMDLNYFLPSNDSHHNFDSDLLLYICVPHLNFYFFSKDDHNATKNHIRPDLGLDKRSTWCRPSSQSDFLPVARVWDRHTLL